MNTEIKLCGVCNEPTGPYQDGRAFGHIRCKCEATKVVMDIISHSRKVRMPEDELEIERLAYKIQLMNYKSLLSRMIGIHKDESECLK